MNSKRLNFVNWLLRLFPSSNWSSSVRIFLFRWAGIEIGKNCEIGNNVVIRGEGRLSICDNVKIYDDVYIFCKKGALIKIKDKCIIATRVYIECGGEIRIGKSTGIWQETLLTANCGSKIIIGDECKIAHRVSVKTTTHTIDVDGVCIGGDDRFDDITIGNGAWICSGAFILPGVNVAEKTLVAAGGVVTTDTMAYTLVAGVPAKTVKKYK